MKKQILGQYFTIKDNWLLPQIKEFIINSNCSIAYDPFVGDGDMLLTAKSLGINKTIGLDVEPKHEHKYNDSLSHIPTIKNAIVITNPPYLTNYSAKRKKIYKSVSKYFETSRYDNIYLIALEKMLQAQKYVVAIVPETFINSNFKDKTKLSSITIIEDNCFCDTEAPVCVVCFDGLAKDYAKIKVFKNNKYLNTLAYYEKMRMRPERSIKIRFNDIKGGIALRAVDTTNPNRCIEFMEPKYLDYDLSGIKHSSRLITLINIAGFRGRDLDIIINESNHILNEYRKKTDDVLLSPFKGNMSNGQRRRRLDYKTASAIIEKACKKILFKGDLWKTLNFSNSH